MADVVVIGSEEVTLVSRKRRFDRNLGNHYEEVYEGPTSAVEAAYNLGTLDPAVDTIDFEVTKGVSRYTKIIQDDDGSGTGQTTEELNSYWEVFGADLYTSILAHQTFSVNATSQDKLDFQDYRGKVAKTDVTVDSSTLSSPVKEYVDLLNMGTDEYLRTQIILQKTVPLGRRSIIQASWAGIDQAHVLATDDPGPNPTSEIIGLITGHPDYISGAKQWLKRAPQISQVEKGRYNIVYNWRFARRWSKTLYGGDDVDGNP